MSKTGYIYKITSPSGKIYIGQTDRTIAKRTSEYRRCRCKKQKLLYRSIKKYGWEAHNFEVVETFTSVNYLSELLDTSEKYWIAFHKSNFCRYKEKGLNLTDGGDGIRGYKHTQELKDSYGKAVDCYNLDGSFYMSFTTQIYAGRHFSSSKQADQTIRHAVRSKRYAYNKIWKYSTDDISVVQEVIDSMTKRGDGRFEKGYTGGVGRKVSEETKRKQQDRVITPEWRRNMSEAAKRRCQRQKDILCQR